MLLGIVFFVQMPGFASTPVQPETDEFAPTQFWQEPIPAETIGDGIGISTIAIGDCLYLDSYSDGTTIWQVKYIDEGDGNISKGFVRYLSNAWVTNNPTYTITESSTVNLSVSGGVSLSIGKSIASNLGWNISASTGVTVSIVIDVLYPEKHNKLALLADYTVKYVRPEVYRNGVFNSTGGISEIKSPTELYYQVVYQN